ncbi:MAG TPA: hypothetical protein VN043_07975 [Rhodanobacter sp.]|nr:hypothetical protein [Rhodanobacter sp.]
MRLEPAQPCYFDPGNELFGMHHPAARSAKAAVLMCPPLGQDLIRTHRVYRQHADAIARQSMPVLRFGYFGTGDSAGTSAEVDWQRCLADTALAADILRQRTGCTTVIGFGAHQGGSIALSIADTARFSELRLCDPVLDDGARVARLDVLQKALRLDPMRFGKPRTAVDAEGQWLGFPVSANLRRQLVNWRAEPTKAPIRLFDSLRPAAFRDWDLLLDKKSSIINVTPTAGWGGAEPTACHSFARSRPGCERPIAGTRMTMERVFCFGRAQHLIGVLANPEPPRDSDPVGVIVLNAGMVHRVGQFRLHVEISRRLNGCGYAALRFDLSPIGVSRASNESRSHAQQIHADVSDAMDLLATHAGCTRFILLGLCSGAQNAHDVAVSETHVVGTIFLDGYAYRALSYYLRHYLPRLWSLTRCRRALKSNILTPAGDRAVRGESAVFFRTRDQVKRALKAMLDRNMKLRFIYSGGVSCYFNHVRQFRECYGRVANRRGST